MTTDSFSPQKSELRILITGATGMVGKALSKFYIEKGATVHGLLRPQSSPKALAHGVVPFYMDLTKRSETDAARLEALGPLDAVVHLAGESIMGRWDAKKKRGIMESRRQGTRHLCELLCGLEKPPGAFVSASAVGYYGEENGDTILDESSLAGDDFLANVCKEWEGATDILTNAGVRVANTRFGVILAKEGGALQAMLPAFKLGIAGKLGSGEQWMSWVHLDDVIRAIDHLLQHKTASGPYNVCSPFPVQNAQYTKVLADVVKRPAIIPAPAFALNLILGEMADALLLASQRCIPNRLQEEAGYKFLHPELKPALEDLVG